MLGSVRVASDDIAILRISNTGCASSSQLNYLVLRISVIGAASWA